MITRNKSRQLGIWMDQTKAHLIENQEKPAIECIDSDAEILAKPGSNSQNESTHRNTEQSRQCAYYNSIGKLISNYSDVVLFGSNNTINELHHILQMDKNFNEINIHVQSSGDLSDADQIEFVKEYFLNYEHRR